MSIQRAAVRCSEARIDALSGALDTYHLYNAVRGDLLGQLGRHAEARAEFLRAAELTGNRAERALLLDRAQTSR
ncbi:transcriptional regulator [Nocardia sp. NPDC051052]|uniref:transcriptional regulator n=1 Tax=Nocardia sp. NPDC051052 TaxID=3364322 RepID=UPI0037B44EB3